MQPALTSLDSSSVVTPEDLSPNAYLQQAQCPSPFPLPKPLHQALLTEAPCSSALQLQSSSSPTSWVLPTIFDFVAHSHIFQPKPSLQARSSQVAPPVPISSSAYVAPLMPLTFLQPLFLPKPKRLIFPISQSQHLLSPNPRTQPNHSTFVPALTPNLCHPPNSPPSLPPKLQSPSLLSPPPQTPRAFKLLFSPHHYLSPTSLSITLLSWQSSPASS